MTTYAPSDTSERAGNKRSPILNLCITPTEQYHFTLPTGTSPRKRNKHPATSHVSASEEFHIKFAQGYRRASSQRFWPRPTPISKSQSQSSQRANKQQNKTQR